MTNDSPGTVHLYKLVLIGSPAVGKSTFCHSCAGLPVQTTYRPTCVSELSMLSRSTRESLFHVQLWDTSPDALKVHSTRTQIFHNLTAVVFFYDPTNRSSFASLHAWANEARRYASKARWFLVSTHADLTPQVLPENGKKFADKCLSSGTEVPFFSVCATNKDQSLRVLDAILNSLRYTPIPSSPPSPPSTPQPLPPLPPLTPSPDVLVPAVVSSVVGSLTGLFSLTTTAK